MTRNTPKLLTGLFALGCGSGAMASPAHGQWTENTGYGGPAAATSQASAGDPSANQAAMCPPGEEPSASTSGEQQSQGGYQAQTGYQPQGGYQPQSGGSPSQGGYQPQRPSQSQDQGQGQNQGQNQDQDEDNPQSRASESGQGHLGVVVMGMTSELRQHFGVPEDRGVLISRVEPNSAASRAGLQVGDVLVRVGPQLVRSGDDVIQALAQHPGGRIRLSVIRQGRPVRLVAMLPGNPSQQDDEQDQL